MGWTNAYPHVSVDWWDCSTAFTCVCGEQELLFSEDGEQTCDNCGRIYRFVTRLDMKERDEAGTT